MLQINKSIKEILANCDLIFHIPYITRPHGELDNVKDNILKMNEHHNLKRKNTKSSIQNYS